MPVYQFTAGAYATPTGSAPSEVLSLWLSGRLSRRITVNANVRSSAAESISNCRRAAAIGGNPQLARRRRCDDCRGRFDQGRSRVARSTSPAAGRLASTARSPPHGGQIAVLNTQLVQQLKISAGFRCGSASMHCSTLPRRGRSPRSMSWDGSMAWCAGRRGKVCSRQPRRVSDTENANVAYVFPPDVPGVVVREARGDRCLRHQRPARYLYHWCKRTEHDRAPQRSPAQWRQHRPGFLYQGIYNDRHRRFAHAGGAGASGGTLTINFEAPI